MSTHAPDKASPTLRPDDLDAATAGMTTEEILRIMRRRIASRQIPAGNKLQEQSLATEFGVPRVRIRDVLVALEQRGLIERQKNRSAVVTRLDLSQVFALYDVRESLEGLSIRLATEKAPKGHWDDLLDAFRSKMTSYAEAGDLDGYFGILDRFRDRTLKAAENPYLTEMLDSIYDRTQAIIHRTIILPGRLQVGCQQLIGVLEAMCEGDAPEAERRRISNIRSQREYLKRYENYVL